MYDIKLSGTTHDVVVENYDLQLVSETERVSQHLKIRLLFFLGEWYLDTEIGVPYFQDILVKSPDIPNVESILINEILDTPDVLELLSFDSFYDTAQRQYSATFQVNTIFGQSETITQEF